MKKSVLFVHPAYYMSYCLRDELRRLGWRADVFRRRDYPEMLNFGGDAILPWYSGPWRILKPLLELMQLLFLIGRYRFFLFYGESSFFNLDYPVFAEFLRRRCGPLELAMVKWFGRKIIFLSNGCRQIDLKSEISKWGRGEMCGNCGWPEGACNDAENQKEFDIRKRFGALQLHVIDGVVPSTQLKFSFLTHQCIDLGLWRPGLAVPEAHRLGVSSSVRIYHGFVKNNREHGGRNIKGTPHVVSAVERLRSEGYAVELMVGHEVPIRDVRYYQAQADIIVDQLIFGWWGSAGMEGMALGKPVVCYLRPEWKERFFSMNPEYDGLPVIEADVHTIYEVLKRCVSDAAYRRQKGKEAREFVERRFDPNKNAVVLAKALLGL